jgi:hypothetical protein
VLEILERVKLRYTLWADKAEAEVKAHEDETGAAPMEDDDSVSPSYSTRLQSLLRRLAASVSGASAVTDVVRFAGWVDWGLRQRMKAPGPELFYTDSCCTEHDMLVSVFPTLRGGHTHDVDAMAPAGLLPMPDTAIITAVPEFMNANAACALLDGAPTLGFDCEWTAGIAGAPRSKVGVLQLATRNQCFVFQLNRLRGADGKLPASLVALLENAAVAKAGVSSKTDATLLKQDYGVKMANVVELKAFALQKLHRVPGTLAAMTARVLGFFLPKPHEVRLSNWDAKTLSHAQVRYAAHDALACALLHEVRHGVCVHARARARPHMHT